MTAAAPVALLRRVPLDEPELLELDDDDDEDEDDEVLELVVLVVELVLLDVVVLEPEPHDP